MEFSLKNDLSELSKLADQLAAFGREEKLPADIVQQLNLALDELVTNTITHGYSPGEDRHIDISLKRTKQGIDLVLSDDARPFNPFDAAEPDLEADIEDRPIGGLGVFLVKSLMDGFSYAREAGRNVVRLRKTLT